MEASSNKLAALPCHNTAVKLLPPTFQCANSLASYAMRGSTSVLTRPVTVSKNMLPTLTSALSTCGQR